MQGDVFDGVTVPGLDEGPGLAMVITHACSMRQGPHLRPRLVMGRIVPRDQPVPLPWKGHFAVFPLPALRADTPDGTWMLSFEELGTVGTATLELNQRVACLDDFGVSLLNQRHAHYFTRYAVESAVLYEHSANVLAEAELLEEWLASAIDDDAINWEERAAGEVVEFDNFLRSIREDLKKASHRAAVRRAVGEETRRRFG